MNIIPHLNFNGQCKEAFEFYAKLLDGEIKFSMTWGEMPGDAADQFPPETHNLIMHTTLEVDGDFIMGADSPPDRYTPPKGITVSIGVKDKAKAEKLFNALAQGGNVTMPFAQTFWSPGFGMCVDRFGIPWMVNTESH
ncbi:MAG TPA: VOC family protein [Pyrinomonadaceae bacterium]|jgi:PhnB protein